MDKNKKKRKSTPSRAKSKKAKSKAPRKDKGSKRGSTRYNSIQKILSEYCKVNDKHLDGKFNYYASLINKGTIGTPLEQVRANFDVIYNTYIEEGKDSSSKASKIFPNEFEFYEFADKLISDPVFDGVVIGIDFNDGREKFSFKGTSLDMLDYYRIYMHKYLRANYNSSPTAMVVISDTDGKGYVDYGIVVGTSSSKGKEEGAKGVPQEPKGASQTDADVARAKADEERAKVVMKALELFEKGLLSSEQLDMILTKLQKGGKV